MLESIDFLARLIGYGVLIIGPIALWTRQREDTARRDLDRMDHQARIEQLEWAKENDHNSYPRLQKEYEEWLSQR